MAVFCRMCAVAMLAAASLMWACGARADEAAPTADDDLNRIVTVIDGHLDSQWRVDSITPAAPADDAEFLRRVTLDINGWVPTVMEAREFLADESTLKRRALIDRLLNDPRYAVHFTNYWRSVLIPEAESDLMARYQVPMFESWLRSRLLDNRSYRNMVREILEVDVNAGSRYNYNEVSPVAFYATKEIKPENLAAATSRMFLGVRLECAQCHDHPFDHWTRRDFWGYSAFFAGLERSTPGPQGFLSQLRELLGQRNVKIPDTNEFVAPTYLGGTPMGRDALVPPRQALANWIVADDNPYFARMAVNRMWGHFFGVGFVDPIDDFSDEHPPSHPELLDALAVEFTAQDYDLKFLIRAITLSRAYNLSSAQTDPSQEHPQQFARMNVKGLSSAQVYDSFVRATGRFEPFAPANPYSFGGNSPRQRIGEVFADQGTTPLEKPTTILQSLAVMNGEFVSQETSLENSRLLRSVAEFPGFATADRIDAIFMAALTRRPTDVELDTFVAYVDAGGKTGNSQQALADVFWVLLNGSEFVYNH